MIDCSNELVKFHNEKVTLPKEIQDKMRERRDINRDKLKGKIKENYGLDVRGFVIQGSYAMRTMIQQPNNDYDIDDGVLFWTEDLVSSTGRQLSPMEVKEKIRDSVHREQFNTPPDIKKNCVRIYYNEGYHIDIPVYRQSKDSSGTEYELASTTWKTTNPKEVTRWFDNCVKSRDSISANCNDALRRTVRFLKKFSKSRSSWSMPSGFILTVLATECDVDWGTREDQLLRSVFKCIFTRLQTNLVVSHPVLIGTYLTKSFQDPNMVKLKDELECAVEKLNDLDKSECSKKQALKIWDDIFNTDFFSDHFEEEAKSQAGSFFINKGNNLGAVNKSGSNTNA